MTDDLPDPEDATPDDIAAVIGALSLAVPEFRRTVAEAIGARVDSPSIMDATRDQIISAGRRAAHADAAMRLVFSFTWSPQEYPTLGDFVRALPEDVRERIALHLMAAGQS
jgi:hypothetical protein